MSECCGESIRVMHPLFHVGEGGSIPTSPLQMTIESISFRFALDLNEYWHSSLPRFGTGFISNMPFPCFGAMYGGIAYAIAIWSNPCARNLQQDWMELRRFAISPDRPKNTATWMLGIMARKLKESHNPQRLISYQDMEKHNGTIYKAAGWIPTVINRDGNWTRKNRPRPKAQSEAPKLRWEKILRGERL